MLTVRAIFRTNTEQVKEMQPIATYTERRIGRRRVYRLVKDRVYIDGKAAVLGNQFQVSVPLKEVNIQKDVIIARDNIRMATCGLPFLLGLIAVGVLGERLYSLSVALFWIALFASFVGMFVGFILAKKIKYYQYKNNSGVVAFDISELGNEKEEFERFSNLIDDQIKQAKGVQ